MGGESLEVRTSDHHCLHNNYASSIECDNHAGNIHDMLKRLLAKCGHNFMLFTDELKRSDCYDSYLFNIINVSTITLIHLHIVTVMTHCLSYS